jgi:hypothetical protein
LIPRVMNPRPIEELMKEANSFLAAAYSHGVYADKPWVDFVAEVEMNEAGANTSYWQRWGDLVRFSWNEVQ